MRSRAQVIGNFADIKAGTTIASQYSGATTS
jgi:hypothetical protein